MGFVLSVLYFVTYYLTPATTFGPLAAAHIELIIAALVFFVSLPALTKSFTLKTPQSLALIGMTVAVFFSVLIGMHWPRGGINAFLEFIPSVFAYFLVCLHCDSKKKLQIVVLMLLLVCLFVTAHGYVDLVHGVPESGPPQAEASEGVDLNLWNVEHPYLLVMRSDAGEWFYRLRGLGEINDPNDFGQLIVSVIPLIFIFWRAKKMFRNVVCVILPYVYPAFRGIPHALARCPRGFGGGGRCGGATPHWDAACAAGGGRVVRCRYGLTLYGRAGDIG